MTFRETRDLGPYTLEDHVKSEHFRRAMLEFNRARIAHKQYPQAWMELILDERNQILRRAEELKEAAKVVSIERKNS